MSSRSRLPPPPARSGARPLPPEPPADDQNDAPPPLPSRPGGHGGRSATSKLPPPPVRAPSPETSDDDDDGQNYEEPDQIIEPPKSRYQPPPAMEPQETYDDLEGVQPESEDEGETYDECDLKAAPQQQQQDYEEDQLYEAEPPAFDSPSPEPADVDGDVYEFTMPDNDVSPPPPPPQLPPVTHSRPHIPLPPEPGAPGLPSRPPPSRSQEPGPDSLPDLPPGRPSPSQGNAKLSNIKKTSGDGPQMLGISMEAIGLKRANLKKVVSDESVESAAQSQSEPVINPENASSVKDRINMFKKVEKVGVQNQSEPVVNPEHASSVKDRINLFKKVEKVGVQNQSEPVVIPKNASSVKDRISMFKNVEKGPKPLLPVKPTLSAAMIASRTSSPPYVPPSRILGPPPPPPQYALCKKPFEVKPPNNTLPPPLKSPTIQPVEQYECDDIYDEGFSADPDPLSREEWYHGEIERNVTNSRLHSIGQDGTFLVRKSTKGGVEQPYTLVVLYQGHVYNLKMRNRKDGQVALGEEKSDELAFQNVAALISHHKSHDVILVNIKEHKQHRTLLKRHPINIRTN